MALEYLIGKVQQHVDELAKKIAAYEIVRDDQEWPFDRFEIDLHVQHLKHIQEREKVRIAYWKSLEVQKKDTAYPDSRTT